LSYLMLSQSAGYVPRRLVAPYLAAGYLFPAHRSPSIAWRLYALHPKGEDSASVQKGLAILRSTIATPPYGKLRDLAEAFRFRRAEE
jgi:hypothetical protein